MNTNQVRAVSMGAGFFIMILSGFWLSRTGKPYGTLVFTVHKLIGVGIGILLFITVRQMHQTAPLSPVEIAAVAVTGLFFVATVATGSLLSIPVSKPMPDFVSMLNKILPYFTVLPTAVTLYLLLSRR
jgi:hypothetical protein